MIDDDLNQKLTKHSPEDARYWAFTREENTYVRTWGLKTGEGVCSKGGLFLGAYGNKKRREEERVIPVVAVVTAESPACTINRTSCYMPAHITLLSRA